MELIEYPEGEICDVIFLTNTANDDVFKMTSNAIKSLRDSETNNKFRIVVVESNQNIDQLLNFNYDSDLSLVYSGEFNYNRALNLAFEHVENNHVAVFNNDVLFIENWYSMLRYNMDIFNLNSASPHCPVKQNGPNEVAQAKLLNYKDSTVVSGFECITEFAGWGWVTTKEIIDKLFPLDEQMSFWFQDNDIALSLQNLRCKHATVVDSKVIHFGQSSYSLIDPSKLHDMTTGLYQTFVKKWFS